MPLIVNIFYFVFLVPSNRYNSITAALKGRVKNDFEKYNDNHLMIEQLKLEVCKYLSALIY
jgi:hypothetical protein